MKLWGSRFDQDISSETLEYTQTIDIDARMLRHDLWGSLAHNLMLARQRIVPVEDGRLIAGALLDLLDRHGRGEVVLRKELEDVHLNVETMVIEALGLEVGGRMHTARSRNDQVVTDARLYVREQLLTTAAEALGLAGTLLDGAARAGDVVMVGYTHSQVAQPISYGFWLSGHASVLLRDVQRLQHAYETVNENPLGACAIAGTSFPIDRQLTTALLGFDRVLLHALDATSSRDFLSEAAAALAILMTHLSRLAEELVWWSTSEFGLLHIGDQFATGSSIMPQKRNPVVAELVRARAGTAVGALVELLTVIKAVPMGYSCDLQQDKPPVWRAFDTAVSTLSILRAQAATIRVAEDRTEAQCWASFATATELANHLVTAHGLPFRSAYHVAGTLVKDLSAQQLTLRNTDAVVRLLAQHGIAGDASAIQDAVSPHSVLARQTSEGATGPAAVAHTVDVLKARRDEAEAAVAARAARIQSAFDESRRVASQFAAGQDIDSLIGRLAMARGLAAE